MILDILHVGNPRKALDFDQVIYQAVDEEGNQINPNPNFWDGYSLPAFDDGAFGYSAGILIHLAPLKSG